jgi:hypothetical protein
VVVYRSPASDVRRVRWQNRELSADHGRVALSVNVPSFPAETINGIVRPAIFLDSSNHIILDAAAAAAASAYGTKFLYAGLPDTVLFPPVADTSHAAADFHLV